MKSTVVVFVKYYLPGFKSGGPIRTIHNLVSTFGKVVDFKIVTNDRDAGDTLPYPGVNSFNWLSLSNSKVMYVSKNLLKYFRNLYVLSRSNLNAVYLNSFFSIKFTILPLIFIKFFGKPNIIVILAPRGEFSPDALALKRKRKSVYISLFNKLNLSSSVCWHLSNEGEADNLKDVINVYHNSKIYIAKNLPNCGKLLDPDFSKIEFKREGFINLVFFSRISPMKNLDFLIRILSRVYVKIKLYIIGPIADYEYWEECHKLLIDLDSDNFKFEYCGPVENSDVCNMMSKMDFFILPTRGENYGHAIFESLSCSVPVIISDRTDWHLQKLANKSIISLPLDDEDAWVELIVSLDRIERVEYINLKKNAFLFSKNYCIRNQAFIEHKTFFKELGLL